MPKLDWGSVQDRISYLYLDECWELDDVRKQLVEEGFVATLSQYKNQVYGKWKMKRNLKSQDLENIEFRITKRKEIDDKDSKVFYNGRLITEEQRMKKRARHHETELQRLQHERRLSAMLRQALSPPKVDGIIVCTPTPPRPNSNPASPVNNRHTPRSQIHDNIVGVYVRSPKSTVGSPFSINSFGSSRSVDMYMVPDSLIRNLPSMVLNTISIDFRKHIRQDPYSPTASDNTASNCSRLLSIIKQQNLGLKDALAGIENGFRASSTDVKGVLALIQSMIVQLENNTCPPRESRQTIDKFLGRFLTEHDHASLEFLLSYLSIRTPMIDGFTIHVLYSSARIDYKDMIRKLLKLGIIDGQLTSRWYNHRGEIGATALQFAMEYQNFDVVDILLNAGADINARPISVRDQSILKTAVETANTDLVHRLVVLGARDIVFSSSIHLIDGDQEFCLTSAEMGYLGEIKETSLCSQHWIQKLLGFAIRTYTAMQSAAIMGHEGMFQVLLDHRLKDPHGSSAEFDHSILLAAATSHNGDILGQILKTKEFLCDLDALGIEGYAALHSAIQSNRITGGYFPLAEVFKTVKTLLCAGANPNKYDDYGRTPLSISIREFRLFDPSELDEDEYDSKDDQDEGEDEYDSKEDQSSNEDDHREAESAFTDDRSILELLIRYGADINQKKVSGESPLYLSVLKGSHFAVEKLLKAGALVNATNVSGEETFGEETALALAIRLLPKRAGSEMENIIDTLLQYGAQDNTLEPTPECSVETSREISRFELSSENFTDMACFLKLTSLTIQHAFRPHMNRWLEFLAMYDHLLHSGVCEISYTPLKDSTSDVMSQVDLTIWADEADISILEVLLVFIGEKWRLESRNSFEIILSFPLNAKNELSYNQLKNLDFLVEQQTQVNQNQEKMSRYANIISAIESRELEALNGLESEIGPAIIEFDMDDVKINDLSVIDLARQCFSKPIAQLVMRVCLKVIPNLKPGGKSRALRLAVQLNAPNSISQCLEHGALVDRCSMIEAVSRGKVQAFDLLLSDNALLDDDDCGRDFEPHLLLLAIASSQLYFVLRLIQRGVDVNYIFSGGVTALEFASQNGRLDAAQVLLEAGASVRLLEAKDTADKLGHFPLSKLILTAMEKTADQAINEPRVVHNSLWDQIAAERFGETMDQDDAGTDMVEGMDDGVLYPDWNGGIEEGLEGESSAPIEFSYSYL